MMVMKRQRVRLGVLAIAMILLTGGLTLGRSTALPGKAASDPLRATPPRARAARAPICAYLEIVPFDRPLDPMFVVRPYGIGNRAGATPSPSPPITTGAHPSDCHLTSAPVELDDQSQRPFPSGVEW